MNDSQVAAANRTARHNVRSIFADDTRSNLLKCQHVLSDMFKVNMQLGLGGTALPCLTCSYQVEGQTLQR